MTDKTTGSPEPGSRVLICDDSVTSCMMLAALLEANGIGATKTITDPTAVAVEIGASEFDLLILDYEMPKMNGLEVVRQIRADNLADEHFPILFLTGHQDADTRNQALELGAADFVNKPFDQNEVVLRVRNLLSVRAAYKAKARLAADLERMVEERTRELSRATDILIQRLAQAGEMRDNDTGKHVLRVGKYARIIAEGAGLPPDIAFAIEKAAPLHDLGKIGIPDSILLKKGRLDDTEREIMIRHVGIGADLLQEHESLLVRMACSIALSHHEHWDGTGYPTGLKGESIPIEGRITAISDVFDALTSERPYKDAWPVQDAVEEIRKGAGSHFDPALVKAFVDNADKIIDTRNQYLD